MLVVTMLGSCLALGNQLWEESLQNMNSKLLKVQLKAPSI